MANKNFIKIAKLIIFLLIFGFLGSYFGNEYFLLKSEVLDKTKEIAKLQLENKKTTELRDKLAICLEDGAIATVEEARGYSFEEFGLYSPDFEGKIINPVSFEYKNNIISKKSINFKDTNNISWGVIVWSPTEEFGNLSSIQEYTAYAGKTDFPIFVGYENYLNKPTFISEKFRNWNKQSLYVNPAKEKMYLSYNYTPKSIGSVQYEFYNPVANNDKGVFVIIWREVENYPMVTLVNKPEVLKAVSELKKVADKISFNVL